LQILALLCVLFLWNSPQNAAAQTPKASPSAAAKPAPKPPVKAAAGKGASSSSASAVPAEQLGSAYEANQQAADAQYKNKPITIKGLVKKVDMGMSSSKEIITCLFLDAGPNKPLVKVEITKVDKMDQKLASHDDIYHGCPAAHWKHSTSYMTMNDRLNGKILCLHIFRGNHKTWAPTTKNPPSPYVVFVSAGDSIVASGVCKGDIVNVVVGEAALQ